MLTKENLISETIKNVPQFDVEYRKMLNDDIIDRQSGNHIVFSYIFTPMLIKKIRKGDNANAKVMFDFLEQMAASDDNSVVEVCDQSVLEELNDVLEDETIYSFMGKKTKEGFEIVKQYMI